MGRQAWGAAMAVVALVVTATAGAARGSRDGDVLLRVWMAGSRVHATYRVPHGMQPYGLSVVPHGVQMMMLPGAADGTVTATSFISSKLSASVLTSTKVDKDYNPLPTTYKVRLLYGRKGACGGTAAWNSQNLSWNNMLRCSHARSNIVLLTVGNLIGPGSLVNSSSASGDYADASVSANVKSPNRFTVRVTSSPGGQSVHIVWNVTCSKGSAVKGASGSWDDTTPVNDGTSIQVPFATFLSNPDSCTIAVGASLEDNPGSGTITIKLYVDKTHV
jgi:hypothetical protein